ncbi:hypothetical protein RFI_25051 [Reticulomyxa filosa]|uniref:Uncharacterized protein n=1 Tax=Reticulomyxa filosa TaxID=46433 RepID=X6MGZ7_RETFI|nr:hypothetical protein RFI_25051 [Reticulomyxa filosa]|eukprot:ETO12325.1 hypothetical protein RFI_25051 [Reticulomyxa filosa]
MFYSNENIKLEQSCHLYKSICNPRLGDPMTIATKLQMMMTPLQLQHLQQTIHKKVMQSADEIERYRHLLWYNLFSIPNAHPRVNEHVAQMQEGMKLQLNGDHVLGLVEMELQKAAFVKVIKLHDTISSNTCLACQLLCIACFIYMYLYEYITFLSSIKIIKENDLFSFICNQFYFFKKKKVSIVVTLMLFIYELLYSNAY